MILHVGLELLDGDSCSVCMNPSKRARIKGTSANAVMPSKTNGIIRITSRYIATDEDGVPYDLRYHLKYVRRTLELKSYPIDSTIIEIKLAIQIECTGSLYRVCGYLRVWKSREVLLLACYSLDIHCDDPFVGKDNISNTYV